MSLNLDASYVEGMELEEVLGVIHGWIGAEVEVSAHGGRARRPVSGVSSRGRLRAGDVLSRPDDPEVFLFVLVDAAGMQVGSFALYADAFLGGVAGWTTRRRSSRSRAACCSSSSSRPTETTRRIR